MRPELTVVGSVNLDLVARCERLPRPGETVTGATFERHPGGKGANQAVAAARLGAHVRFVGAVGADREALRGLEEAGVELELQEVDAPTGVALVLVDAAGETMITVAPGANEHAHAPDDLSGVVLCQLEIPVETVAAAAERADRLFLNAAPARGLPQELIERAELVIVNSHEAPANPYPDHVLVAITYGASGARLLRGARELARAAPPRVTSVDGTAAGDAFTACLVVSLLEGRDEQDALRRACAAGALAASRPGAQPSLPTAAEVDAILAASPRGS